MKKLNFYMITLVTVLFFAACGKDGAVGPTGATGTQGVVGPAGPTGADGQDGSVIYSGTTVPNTTTGKAGDFYLNTSTGLLYGPKTADGWGTGTSLKGATGATGAAGSKIYSASGAPATTLGVNGDYYLDVATYLLYGPKTAAGWGTPVSLQGPAGNANVKTDVFSLKSADWLWNSQYEFQNNTTTFTEYFTRYYVRPNNSITQDVLDNGMVLVYFTPNTTDNNNQWSPLPFQFAGFGGAFDYNIAFETSPGSVKLHYFFVQRDKTVLPPALNTYSIATYKFKIVAVSGKLGTFLVAHHVNLNSYDDVSKATTLWHQNKN